MSSIFKNWRRLLIAAVVMIIVGAVGFFGYVAWDLHRDYPAITIADDGEPAAVKIARGRYVAIASDCTACHTTANGPEFAGGYEIETPFGPILTSNITQDKATGIGNWTKAQFDRALRHGKGSNGYLYPAMPYNAYTKLSDRDIDDLWAYMKTVAPVRKAVDENQMPFPFNQRWLLGGWNMLFFRDARFSPDAERSAQVNRGAYLVEGATHCGACHTAKNWLGGDSKPHFAGSVLGAWYAPDITRNPHVGLGRWSDRDLVQYLGTGTNRYSVASGEMGLAVEKSLQHLTGSDLKAISAYLRSLPVSTTASKTALAANDTAMQTGKRVYDSQCSACHSPSGEGVRAMIPRLAGNASINATSAASLLNVVLNGATGPVTHRNPTGAGMPRFDWKLSDDQIAAVLTYIRNSWGNTGTAVSTHDVAAMRKQTHGTPTLVSPKTGS